MGPIQTLRIFTRGKRLLELFEKAFRDWDVRKRKGETDMSKHPLLSKTLWINVLTAAADLMGVLPLPQGWSVPALAVVNVVLRVLTNKGLSLAPK